MKLPSMITLQEGANLYNAINAIRNQAIPAEKGLDTLASIIQIWDTLEKEVKPHLQAYNETLRKEFPTAFTPPKEGEVPHDPEVLAQRQAELMGKSLKIGFPVMLSKADLKSSGISISLDVLYGLKPILHD